MRNRPHNVQTHTCIVPVLLTRFSYDTFSTLNMLVLPFHHITNVQYLQFLQGRGGTLAEFVEMVDLYWMKTKCFFHRRR